MRAAVADMHGYITCGSFRLLLMLLLIVHNKEYSPHASARSSTRRNPHMEVGKAKASPTRYWYCTVHCRSSEERGS